MKTNIRLHIDNPTRPPKIFIDEVEYPVVSIEYEYDTETNINFGTHRLLVEYLDKDNKRSTTYIGFDRKE